MNKLRYTLPLLVSVSSVQAVEIEPMIYVDSVVYGDSVHGKGSEYLQEA